MLMELLFLVSLLGIFSLAAAEVFQWSVALPRRADQTQATLAQFDDVVHRLRQDVWSAATIELPDPRTAQLRQPDGNVIIWKLGDGRLVSRQISGAPGASKPGTTRSWQIPDSPMTFALTPAGLLLEVAVSRGMAVHGSASTTSGGAAGISMPPAQIMISAIPLVSELRLLNREEKP